MTSLELPDRPRILVITLRRLGDVLLTTPLIRTMRRGLPRATLDMLVFGDTEDILRGIPDIDHVVSMPTRPSAGDTLALVRHLWRRYDLAVSTQAGDRPTFFALAAARRRVGLVPHAGKTGAWWKRHAHHIAVTAEPDGHRVTQLLRLATALGLDHVPEVVCPADGHARDVPPGPAIGRPAPQPVLPLQAWARRGLGGARPGTWGAGARGGRDRGARAGRASLYR